METRCRLCAECHLDQLPILDNISSKIIQLFQIKIRDDDRLPTTICKVCNEMVEKTWDFNNRIQKAQSVLTELVNAILTTSAGGCETGAIIEGRIAFTIVEETDDVTIDYVPIEEGENVKTVPLIKVVKSKIKKPLTKKKPPTNSETTFLNELDDFEIEPDGSITTKTKLPGWESYPWTCCDCNCNQVFALSEDLREHFANIHGTAPRYVCVDCPKVYAKYSTFISHVKMHRVKLQFCCDVCYKWYPSLLDQEKHRTEHGDERPHACNTCGKRFRMQSALLVHARSHLPTELKNRYQCDLCPKRFGTRPNLMAHKRIHTGIREYTCDQCGKSFVQKGNLDNHLLTHTAVRPFECSVCGKTFKTQIRLRKHSSVHSGHKPHQCEVCGRKFRERSTLKEHLRIHTGAMPFTCEFCGKCFRFKGVLTTHRRQHTGERPYSCNECQHHFTNWPNYNKHMKRRHGINTSVTCRTRQDIPPTGMPHRNPPGTVLAPPQQQPTAVTPPSSVAESFEQPTFYPVLSLYNIPEELLQQRM